MAELLFCLFGWLVWLGFFETGFLCVALAVLELFVDQTGLKLRNPPASASRALGLKACGTMPGCTFIFLSRKQNDSKHLAPFVFKPRFHMVQAVTQFITKDSLEFFFFFFLNTYLFYLFIYYI